jgi:acyl-coenzyme A synthetase/AMP-(fatty) acid ligase
VEENVRTIGALIERNARRYRDKPYLCFGDRQVSYEEIHRITNKLANGLLKTGIRKGDKICVMMTNRPEFLYSWFAINKIGAIMVPVNTAFRGPELAYIIRHAESKAIICEAPFWPALHEISGDDRFPPIIATGDVEGNGIVSFVGLLDGSPEKLPPMGVSETDHAVYPYTSGTTGPPKGVMLSHRTYVQTARSFVTAVGAGPNDRIMTPNPLFHINAECYSTMGSMAAGATLILLDRFSASGLAAEIERHRPTILVLVLASATILYNKYRQSDPWHTSLRTIMAGGVPRGEYRNFERTFGVKLQNIYSMTETPMGLMSPLEAPSRDGGVGYPMPVPEGCGQNRMRLVNDQGSDCATDEIGEIVIQNTALMEGYFKDPAATRQALRDGFFYTGDKGRRDADGYVYFVGRARDILRKKGHNISAAEVEGVLNSHPAVAEAAVIGIASDYGDDEVKAVVVFRQGSAVEWNALQQWCAARLAAYKVPQVFEAIDALPKNAMGRVMKNKLHKTMD